LVLAAGLGTRLRPLTDAFPKALVPVGDRSALAHAVDSLRRADATRIAANAHHVPDAIVRACSALEIGCSVEETLLGTAGGLTKARAILGDGAVLVWNADIFAPEIDAAALVRAYEANARTSRATLLVREVAKGGGNVGWDEAGRIVRLRKESVREGEHASGEFLGIHVVGPEFPRIASGCLVGDVYLPALRAGAELHVECTRALAHDLGTASSYLDANRAWLDARGAKSFVAEGARVAANASIVGSVIGAGAIVDADATECVVWPGARVETPQTRAIVAPSVTVSTTNPPQSPSRR
jgi:NDP-sugar pyrophosphorylase family protein